jgi:hypothetical protein
MEQKIPLNAIAKNPFNRSRRSSDIEPSHPWVRYAVAGAAVASIFGLVVLVLMLAFPISMLAVGVHYRDWRYCPIEPRISRFLIVGGAVSFVWIILTIILSVMTMFLAYTRWMIAVICVVILSVITIVGQIFSIIWLIVGSVWTFGIRNRVQFTINYPFNIRFYCHRTLYDFTFAYLIMIYIFIALQLACRCCTFACRSKRQK